MLFSEQVLNALQAWYQEPERGDEPWARLNLGVESPAPRDACGFFTCHLDHSGVLPDGCEMHLTCGGLSIDLKLPIGSHSQWPHYEKFQVSEGQTGEHVVTCVLRVPAANGVWQRGVTMQFRVASSGGVLKIGKIEDAGAVVARQRHWDRVEVGEVKDVGTVLLKGGQSQDPDRYLRELASVFLPHPLPDVAACKEFLPLPGHPFLRCHRFPVTQELWEDVMEYDLIGHLEKVNARGLIREAMPHVGADKPMVYVSLDDAVRFCQTVTAKWRGREWIPRSWCVRLLRRREWERARGRAPDREQLKRTAWMKENRLHDGPHEVRTSVCLGHAHHNEHGFYHLLGNVFERTLDSKDEHAALGGYWRSPVQEIMDGLPGDFGPDRRSSRLGFRVMLAPVGNWHAPSL